MYAGETLTFGRWPQVPGGEPEPLTWLVLDARADGAKLLLAQQNLEQWCYHESYEDITWRDCDLRLWLNTAFLSNAFTPGERSCIAPVVNANQGNASYRTYGGDETCDQVFCLSVDQATRLLPTDADRVAQPTAYAYRRDSGPEWWLRGPGYHQHTAAYVGAYGRVSASGYRVNRDRSMGVRPALWLAPAPVAAPAPLPRPRFDDAVRAMRYAAVEEAARLLAAGESAEVDRHLRQAVDGGYAARCAILQLKVRGALSSQQLVILTEAGIGGGDFALAVALADEGGLTPEQCQRLCNKAVYAGNVPFALRILGLYQPTPEQLATLCQTALGAGRDDVADRLLGMGTLTSADLQALTQTAISHHQRSFALRAIGLGRMSVAQLSSLCRVAVGAGDKQVTRLLLDQGAQPPAFTRMVNRGSKRDVLVCAAMADPQGAADAWTWVKDVPEAVRYVMHAMDLEHFPSKQMLLRTLAEGGYVEELRMLVGHEGYFTPEGLARAVQGASAKGHAEAVAFLMEQQAQTGPKGRSRRNKPDLLL